MNEEKPLEDMTDEELLATFPINSMARQLWIATQGANKIPPRPKHDKSSPSPRKSIAFVRVGAGRSTLQERSERRRVFLWISDAAGEKNAPVSIEAAVEVFGKSVRGHIQKLLEAGWLEVVEND